MAGTIDQLNFEVILDDKEFTAKVKQDIQLANQLNTSLSSLLDIKKQVGKFNQDDVNNNRKAQQILKDNVRAQEAITREKMKTEGLQKKINAQIDRATKGYQSQSRILNELKGYALGYLSIHGAGQLLSSLVRVTGEFELQKTTLAAMLGDLNQAEQVITRIQGLAVESPFQFKELTTYAKQLSAFSVPAQELYDTTKMLADISAGLGVGMDRIVLAYGQVRSAAFLRGQEVRQFTEAGIPILDELAKQFSELEGRAVSTGEVFDKISARLVPFEMVAKVFKDMTSEGGKFYNMQEVQAETLRGKISNLKDAYEVMLNEIGSAHSDKLKGAIDGVRNLMQNWEKIGGQLVDLIKLFGAYKVAVGLLSISDTIAKFGGLAKAIQSTAAAQRLMNSALMTNPYIAVATAITAVAIAVSRHRKELGSTTAAQNEYNRRVKELERIDRERSSAIRNLIDTVQDETQATVEREAALISLKDAYPEIFSQYDIESLKLADILKIKKQISEEDAKRKKVEAYGSLGAQEGRIKALIARGASDNHIESATAVLREMQKGYLEKYVLPNMVSGLRDMTDDALNKALQDAYRKSQYNTRGIEQFDGIPTTQDFYEDLYAAIQAEIKRRNSTKLVDGWRKKVQDTLSDLGLDEGTAFGLWAKDTTQSTEYVDALIKRYKELGEQIKNVSSFDKEQTERLQRNKDAIEAVAKALNIDIKASTAPKGGNKKSQAQIDLELQIDLVKKLQDAYDKLRPYVDDKTMKDTLAKFFPDAKKEWIDSLDFTTVIKSLADELEKYDKDAAERLRNSIGKTGIDGEIERLKQLNKGYKDSAEAAGNYFNELRRWSAEDFTIDGEGVAFDIGKIASDLQESLNEIELRAQKTREIFSQIGISDTQKPTEEALAKIKTLFEKEFGEGSWDKFYDEFLSKGLNAIEDLSDKQRGYERKLAQERLNDLAKKYVDEQTDSLNLSDWGDKSIAQIEAIRQKLIDLKNEDIELPQSTVDALAALGLSVDDLIAKIRELFGEQLDNASIEKFKALSDIIGEVTSMASSLGDQLMELGDTMGSDFLRGFGKSLKYLDELTGILTECDSLMQVFSKSSDKAAGEVEQIVEETTEITDAEDDAAEGMENIAKSSDWVTMAIKLVVSLIGKVAEGINGSQQALQEARLTAIEYANAINQIEFDNLMASFDSVFGVDAYGKALEAMQKAREYQNAILESQKQIGVTSKDLLDFQEDSSGWATFSKGLQDAWKNIKDLGEGDIIVDQRNGWQQFWGTGNDLIKTFSLSDFIDDEGMLKGAELREFYEAYGEDISDANAAAIAEMLGQYDLYVAAVEEVTSYMSDIFDSVADNMADSFIEAFKLSGEAALDYGDIMDEVATNIAQSVIKSMLLQNVFTDKMQEDAVKKLSSGDTTGAMAVVEQAMQAAQDLTPYVQDFLEQMEPYFNMEQEGTTDLGQGIKGITEDQANLIASYLNAMRADVSMMKGVQLKYLPAIGESMPTIMEHLARIEANTYNNSVTTQEILSELRSVATSENGAPSIRVVSLV